MSLKIFIIILLIFGSSLIESKKHIVCYHGTWSTYRPSLGKFDVSNIDPFLCTHIVYAFFGINSNGDLRIIDPYLDLQENSGRGNIREFNDMKLKNPTLKTLAAVGGWNEGSKNFSIVASDPQKRTRFVQSVVSFIQRHGFDGIDLDWEYPHQRHNISQDNDRENFVHLLHELKEGLNPFGYILSAAVGSAQFSAELSYQSISEISQYLDLINVMAYDLHGPWDPVLGINAPLHAGKSDKTQMGQQLNVEEILKYWIQQGAPKDKLILGVPFYGRTFTMASMDKHEPGDAHIGRGLAGKYSREPGTIGYNELCEQMLQEEWSVQWESQQMVPYAFKTQARQWVGYENLESIRLKAEYAIEQDIGGIMIWSLEFDDFLGKCGEQNYPLLREINKVLYGKAMNATGLNGSSSSQSSVGQTSQIDDHKLDDVNCKPKFVGYEVDVKDSSKFYYCQNGLSYSFSCPQGLKFDTAKIICDYPKLIKNKNC